MSPGYKKVLLELARHWEKERKYRNVAANGERCVFLVDGHGVGDGGRDMEEKRWVLKEYKDGRIK